MATPFGEEYDPKKDVLNSENNLMPVWGSKTQEVSEIPMTSDDPQSLTIEKMFPLEYSMDPVSGGKFITLQEFNGLFKTLTTQIKNYFLYLGTIPYNEREQADRGGYPLDAVVSILYDEFTGTLCTPETLQNLHDIEGITKAERRAKAQRLLVRSLKPENTDSPLVRESLFKTWEIMDGALFGQVKEMMIYHSNGMFPPPPGYLDIGALDTTEYSLSDYPRVAIALQATEVCGHFKKKGDDKFTITDCRGLFARVFNNNASQTNTDVRDPGRSFPEVQQDAMGVITGAVMLASAYGTDDSKYGDSFEKMQTIKGFCPLPKLPSHYEDNPKYAHLKDLTDQNAFKTLNIHTSYDMDSESRMKQGIYATTLNYEFQKALTTNALVLDTSDHPKSAHEVRPKNYCVKRYIKV